MSAYLPPARPTLAAALRDVHARTPAARRAAAERLGDCGDEPDATLRELAVEGLVALARDGAPDVKRVAVAALGLVPADRTFDAAVAALDDPDPTVAEAAVVSWARLAPRHDVDAQASTRLARLLDDPRPGVRFQATSAVAPLAPPDALASLLGVLDDVVPEVRAAAAAGLGDLGDPAAVEPLVRRLGAEPDDRVRTRVALALADLGDARGVGVLRDTLGSDDLADAIAAAEALGRLAAEPAREELARRAGRRLGPLLVRAAAATALARLGDPRGVEGLRAVLTAWRPDGRTYALRTVAELRLEALRPEVEALRADPRGADPEAVAEALTALAGR